MTTASTNPAPSTQVYGINLKAGAECASNLTLRAEEQLPPVAEISLRIDLLPIDPPKRVSKEQ